MPPSTRARADTRARRRGLDLGIELPPPAELRDLVDAVTAHPKYLAQIVDIETPKGPAPFNLWDFQVEALDLALANRYMIALKSRQLGFTWTLGSLLAFWDCIAYPSGSDLVVSINEEDAKEVVYRAKFMYDSTPEWFQVVFPTGHSNTSMFSIEHFGGTFSRFISLSASGNAGRSRTFRRLIADESARWDNAKERMASLRPTVADGGSLIQISTARGMNHFYDIYMGAADPGDPPTDPGNSYIRIFVPADARPDRSKEWIDAERRALGELGPQEYPLSAREAFISSGDCVFDMDGLQDQLDYSVCAPEYRANLIEPAQGLVMPDPHVTGMWSIWDEPRTSRSYLVVADISEGVSGGAYSYISVVDALSWDQVACLHGHLDPDQVAEEMALAGRWYHDAGRPALLVPEANNHGAATVAVLKRSSYPIGQIYRQPILGDIKKAGQTQKLGWSTTAKSRPLMISELQTAIREGTIGIRDHAAIGEMLTFVRNDTGRIEAEEGCFDDRVMTWGITCAVLSRMRVATPRQREQEKAIRRTRLNESRSYRVSAKTGY